MKLADVLVKPILSEKANQLSEKSRVYSFKVARLANKLEIKKAVEEFYGVTVEDVRTAVVTVGEGETIDLYANI
jgi:large subunit ribosomal protein L23